MDIPTLPAATSTQMVQFFKLLADDTRLQILYFLTQRPEINVGTLCELLGQSQPAVSHHLALMRAAEVIVMRRAGKHNFYRLQPQKFETHARLVFSILPTQAQNWPGDWLSLAPLSTPVAPVSAEAAPGSSGA